MYIYIYICHQIYNNCKLQHLYLALWKKQHINPFPTVSWQPCFSWLLVEWGPEQAGAGLLETWAPSQYKHHLSQVWGFPYQRSFNMELSVLVRQHVYIEPVPWSSPGAWQPALLVATAAGHFNCSTVAAASQPPTHTLDTHRLEATFRELNFKPMFL